MLVYSLGRRASPKPAQNYNGQSEYACGEKAPLQRLRINISLYRYLIYFTIFDASVLLLAFAALLGKGTNIPLLILYLSIMFASSLLLLEGGKE